MQRILPACMALTERRYRRNWFVRFIAALYELVVPSQNDKSGGLRRFPIDKRQSSRYNSVRTSMKNMILEGFDGRRPILVSRINWILLLILR